MEFLAAAATATTDIARLSLPGNAIHRPTTPLGGLDTTECLDRPRDCVRNRRRSCWSSGGERHHRDRNRRRCGGNTDHGRITRVSSGSGGVIRVSGVRRAAKGIHQQGGARPSAPGGLSQAAPRGLDFYPHGRAGAPAPGAASSLCPAREHRRQRRGMCGMFM